jgi:hypothetical protein
VSARGDGTAAGRAIGRVRGAMTPLIASHIFEATPRYEAGGFHPVKVGPRFVCSLVPSPAERPQHLRASDARARLSAVAGEGAPAGLGDGFESDAISRPGGSNRPRSRPKGVTRLGKRLIRDAGPLMDAKPGCWGFWTVTLPPSAVKSLSTVEAGWPKFQDTMRRRFAESLSRAMARRRREKGGCLPPMRGGVFNGYDRGAMWAFVVEPHKSGLPHLHIIFLAKPSRNAPWFLDRDVFDRLIAKAIEAVTGDVCTVAAAGKLMSVDGRASRYLTKYLAKGAGDNALEAMESNGVPEGMIPRRWWGISHHLRDAVGMATARIPRAIVSILSVKWREMEEAGLLKGGVWNPPSPGAPGVLCIRFNGAENFLRAMEVCYVMGLDWIT